MNYKLLYSLLFLSLLSGLLCANTLFSEFKNMTSEGDSGIQAHRVVLKRKPEKIPETNSAIKKISENASISEDIKYILSMKKDTFESTTDFRKKRKIKLDLLQAKWKKCMDSGRECYHSGMAELTNYDADKEFAYFKLDWLKSVKNVIAKVKTIKKVNAKIPRHEARKLFSEKKVLPFFINFHYVDNDLVVNKMIVGSQYEMGNNKISKPKLLQQNLPPFLHSYINAGNSAYSPSVAARYYASSVRPYFQIRNASRQDILRDKKKYYRKWPSRDYQLTKYTVIDRYQRAGLSYLEVILEIDWRVSSPKRGERTGHSVVTMTLVANEASYKITAVRNAHIQRDIPDKTSSAHKIYYSPDGTESREMYAPVYFSSNGIEGKMECKRMESHKTCTVTASNYVGTGKGGISISFPGVSYRDASIRLKKSRGFNGSVKFYSQGSLLWSTQYRRKINSNYLMMEGWAKRWRRGETKRIEFVMTGRTSSVQVRAVVVRNRREYIAPADYHTIDQQGYPVAVLRH